MVLLIVVKPIPPLVHPFIKLKKRCDSKYDDGIKNALSRIMANDLKLPLINQFITEQQPHEKIMVRH